jgi:hypothetical protein
LGLAIVLVCIVVPLSATPFSIFIVSILLFYSVYVFCFDLRAIHMGFDARAMPSVVVINAFKGRTVGIGLDAYALAFAVFKVTEECASIG